MLSLHAIDDLFMPAPFFHGVTLRPAKAARRHQLHETDDGYELSLPLPGMRPDDLAMSIEDGVLSISGETKATGKHFEASHRLRLPRDVDAESASAMAEHGIVKIMLPKLPRATHQLPVAEGSDSLSPADTDYQLTVAVPGVRPSDLKVSCEDGVLSIEGETKAGYQHLVVSRQHRLPDDANFEAGSAAAQDGILTIVVPKRERPAARKLSITSAGAARTLPVAARAHEDAAGNAAAASA